MPYRKVPTWWPIRCWARYRNQRTHVSKHIAVPSKCVPSLPVSFATAESGARFPLKMVMCPVDLIGVSSLVTTSWLSNLSSSTSSWFWASVCGEHNVGQRIESMGSMQDYLSGHRHLRLGYGSSGSYMLWWTANGDSLRRVCWYG